MTLHDVLSHTCNNMNIHPVDVFTGTYQKACDARVCFASTASLCGHRIKDIRAYLEREGGGE